MTMQATLSLDSLLILFVFGVFMLVSHLEGKTREAVHELRMEHRNRIAELSAENRQLRSESSKLRREIDSVQQRMERLSRQ